MVKRVYKTTTVVTVTYKNGRTKTLKSYSQDRSHRSYKSSKHHVSRVKKQVNKLNRNKTGRTYTVSIAHKKIEKGPRIGKREYLYKDSKNIQDFWLKDRRIDKDRKKRIKKEKKELDIPLISKDIKSPDGDYGSIYALHKDWDQGLAQMRRSVYIKRFKKRYPVGSYYVKGWVIRYIHSEGYKPGNSIMGDDWTDKSPGSRYWKSELINEQYATILDGPFENMDDMNYSLDGYEDILQNMVQDHNYHIEYEIRGYEVTKRGDRVIRSIHNAFGGPV